MLNLKLLLALFVVQLHGQLLFSQSNPYEIVVSGGTGASLSNRSLKTVTNLGLKEAGLDSRVQSTLMVNGMLDVSVAKKVSVGVAYTHMQFYWADAFQDTIQGIASQASATISIQKRNYGLRCLYHFGNSENFEVYGGVRLGMTHWKIDINGQASSEATTKAPVSEFSLPATYPSIQALGGFRHYFGRVFGWFGEVGVGTSPYFCSVGLNVRLNPKK